MLNVHEQQSVLQSTYRRGTVSHVGICICSVLTESVGIEWLTLSSCVHYVRSLGGVFVQADTY